MFVFNATRVNLEDPTQTLRILIAVSVTSTVTSLLSLAGACLMCIDRRKVYPEPT